MSDDNNQDLTEDKSNDDVQALIAQAVAKEVEGLQRKNQELIGKLKEAQGFKSQFDGVDIESVKTLAQKLKQDEELQLLANGKHEELFERKVEPLKQKYESELAEYKAKLAKRDAATLNGGLLANITASGVDPQAVEGVLAIAKGKFNALDENLNPVAKDENGEVIYGSSGKPLTPQEWLNQLRESNPFYWGQVQGSGAKGNQGGGQGQKTLAEMTEQERRQLKAENPELFKQMISKR